MKVYKSIAIAIVALFVVAAMPTINAETANAEYDLPAGAYRLNEGSGCAEVVPACGPAVTTAVCPNNGAGFGDEGVLSDAGDELVFGPAGFTADDNPEDLALTTACDGFQAGFGRGVHIGVFDLTSECGDCFSDFQVTVTDTLPTSTFFTFCVVSEHQDGRANDGWCGEDPACTSGADPSTCDDIADGRVQGCGAGSLSVGFLGGGSVNSMNAFVYAFHVDETSGGVCLGSKGSLTADMN